MTFQQIQFATVCFEAGSISAAAQKLFTSASNVSKTLSALEVEIGFPIFLRSARGLVPTHQGEEFIVRAHTLMSEYDRILNIYTGNASPVFSCACPPLPCCDEAFSRLCRQYQEQSDMDFSLFEGSFHDCCRRVTLREAQLAVVIIPDSTALSCRKYLAENELEATPLKTLQYYIKFRKDHPLASRLSPAGKPDLSLLADYPRIDYQCSPYGNHPEPYNNLLRSGQDGRKKIHINSADRKFYCLTHTDAYSISLGLYPFDEPLACIPLADETAELCCVRNKALTLLPIAEKFIAYLREELDS